MTTYDIIMRRFAGTEFARLETAEAPIARGGRLYIPASCIEALAEAAFTRTAFYYRRSHLDLLALAYRDAGASANERLAVRSLLENAAIAADGLLPLCQDTGSACVYAWKEEGAVTGSDDRALLERGIAAAYRKRRLRASQTAPSSFFDEYNTGDNLPAQIHIEAAPLGTGVYGTSVSGTSVSCYRFLFIAKGGGSSNKTAFYPMTPSLLNEADFGAFLKEKIEALGTAACPPYRLAVVAGGSSPEHNLEILKLATAELLDDAPFFDSGHDAEDTGIYGTGVYGTGVCGAGVCGAGVPIYRDAYWEARAMEIAERSGLGAQLGGRHLALDARVLRLPRHAASFPVSVGVSCAAHRCVLAYIGESGVFAERLEEAPGPYLKATLSGGAERLTEGRRVNLDRPMSGLCAELAAVSAEGSGEALLLSGPVLVARDAAHLAWSKLLERGEPLPDYLFRHPVFYAGPSETPPGKAVGSIGPTTSARMDSYAEALLSRGASLVTIGKGRRTALWTDAARKYGGFYLTAVGGAAALAAERHAASARVIDYPDLGMEAVRLVELRDLPAFLLNQ